MQSQQLSMLREGLLAATSLLLGMIPFGIVAGVAMVSAGLTQTQAVAMGILVFAGSAQLAVVPLFIAKAPLWVMYATALVVNLRYLIYSAVLAPYFGHLPRAWRALLSYITVDGMFALFVGRFAVDEHKQHRHWYYFGGSLLLWLGWQISSWIGIFVGALIPKSWSLEFASTVSLIAILMPLFYDRAVVAGALAAGAVALLAAKWPLNLGLLAAVAVGVAAGLTVSRFAPPARRA